MLHGGNTDPWAILVDEFLVESLAPYFDASSPYSDVAALCLPIHFHSLSDDNIEKLDRALAAFSPDLARHRLILQIVGLPEFRGSVNVQRAVHWARTHSQHVAIELPPEDRHAPLARSAGAGLVLLQMPTGDEEKRETLLKQVHEQGVKAKHLGMRAMLTDVNLLDQFATATKAGFTFVSGRVIGGVVEGPRPPYSLTMRKIVG